ncbi:hypothetical protein BS78_07G073600 [Paspalum vaginatum]|nr:hypothetical protein BS78_07G073600 [Paspalum vaginatum]
MQLLAFSGHACCSLASMGRGGRALGHMRGRCNQAAKMLQQRARGHGKHHAPALHVGDVGAVGTAHWRARWHERTSVARVEASRLSVGGASRPSARGSLAARSRQDRRAAARQ